MRLLIIGLPGCGKTTLAKALSPLLNAPHIEVDRFFWGLKKVSAQELNEAILPLLESKDWIVEGHFSKTFSQVLPRIDRVIWLDYPFTVTLRRALRRTASDLLHRKQSFGQSMRFVKLVSSRRLNVLFEDAFKGALQRGVSGIRVTRARVGAKELSRALACD